MSDTTPQAVILSSLFAVADRFSVEAALYELAHRHVKLQNEYDELFQEHQDLLDINEEKIINDDYEEYYVDDISNDYIDVEVDDEDCPSTSNDLY